MSTTAPTPRTRVHTTYHPVPKSRMITGLVIATIGAAGVVIFGLMLSSALNGLMQKVSWI